MEKNKKLFDNLLENRKNLIPGIIRNIEVNSKYVKDIHGEKTSYNLAICDSYGSGKSYFMKAFRECLEDKEILKKFFERKNINNDKKEDFELKDNFKVISINAWQDDFLKDPILSIGLQINEEIKNDIEKNRINKNPKNKLEKLENFGETVSKTARIVGKKALPILCKGVFNYTVNKLDIKEDIKDISKELTENFVNEDFLSSLQKLEDKKLNEEYFNYNKSIDVLKNTLKEYIKFINTKEKSKDNTEKTNKKIIIIVDELDRCRPNYAVDFLEAVNHIFNVYGIVFVFGIDRKQLSSAMKVVYGQDLNFDAYFKKFVHYEFKLDLLNKNENNKQFILILNNSYKLGLKNSWINNFSAIYESLTPRDIEYAFRILLDIKNNKNYNEDSYHTYVCCLLFLIFVKAKNYHIYYKLFNKKNSDLIDLDLDVLNEIFDKFIINLNEPEKKYYDTIVINGIISDRNELMKTLSNSSVTNTVNELFKFEKYLSTCRLKELKAFKQYIVDNDKTSELKSLLAYLGLGEPGSEYYNFDLGKSILRYCYESIG